MKRLSIVSAAVLSAIVAAPAMAFSGDEAGSIYIGPRIGLFGTDSDRRVIENNQVQSFGGGFDSLFGGIEGGYQFTPEWGYRVYYDYLRGDLETSNDSSSGAAFGMDIIYNFSPNVFGSIGINSTEFSDISNQFVRVGAGYKQYINDNWALTLEGAVQQNDGDLTEFMFMTGLRYYFGGSQEPTYTKPEPTPAPEPQPVAPVMKDSDGDGVMDDKDKCPNTQAGFKVDAEGCVMYANETVTRELTVTFALNSAEISSAQTSDIRDTAEFLKEYPQLNVVIEGHTDDTGAATYNQQLSDRRANAVGNSLINDFGIAASRVTTVGYGESRPKYPNNSAENRAKNRRIEAVMSVTKQVPVQD
ncbi:OmpA family protein [Pseudidiomarina sp.]|uniref:OmpA family protein n=1 Tax=Pseudidiomarina sp. TaxID=2081707 RepID=UPI003A97D131